MKVCCVCQRCYGDSVVSCDHEGHPALNEKDNRTPDMIAGYRLELMLDSGMKGETYRVTQIASGRHCLIKIILPPSSEDSERFLREAKAAALFFHPNVADVYEAGSLATGEVYVVAEDTGGQTLREFLSGVSKPELLTTIAIIREAAEALHALHINGLVHGAVAPENIVLTTDVEDKPVVKIQNLDFGGVVGTTILSDKFRIDSALDSIRYFAPERCSGSAATPLGDVYSLGVVYYEMLAGEPPFNASTAAALIHKQKNLTPQDVRIENFHLRMLVTHSLTESLQKRFQARQSSANTLARQLRHMEQLATHSSTPPPAMAAAVGSTMTASSMTPSNAQPSPSRLEAPVLPATPPKVAVPAAPTVRTKPASPVVTVEKFPVLEVSKETGKFEVRNDPAPDLKIEDIPIERESIDAVELRSEVLDPEADRKRAGELRRQLLDLEAERKLAGELRRQLLDLAVEKKPAADPRDQALDPEVGEKPVPEFRDPVLDLEVEKGPAAEMECGPTDEVEHQAPDTHDFWTQLVLRLNVETEPTIAEAKPIVIAETEPPIAEPKSARSEDEIKPVVKFEEEIKSIFDFQAEIESMVDLPSEIKPIDELASEIKTEIPGIKPIVEFTCETKSAILSEDQIKPFIGIEDEIGPVIKHTRDNKRIVRAEVKGKRVATPAMEPESVFDPRAESAKIPVTRMETAEMPVIDLGSSVLDLPETSETGLFSGSLLEDRFAKKPMTHRPPYRSRLKGLKKKLDAMLAHVTPTTSSSVLSVVEPPKPASANERTERVAVEPAPESIPAPAVRRTPTKKAEVQQPLNNNGLLSPVMEPLTSKEPEISVAPVRRLPTKIEILQLDDDVPSEADVRAVLSRENEVPAAPVRREPKKIEWQQPDDDIPSEADLIELLTSEQIEVPPPPVHREPTRIEQNQVDDDIPSKADVLAALAKEPVIEIPLVQAAPERTPVVQAEPEKVVAVRGEPRDGAIAVAASKKPEIAPTVPKKPASAKVIRHQPRSETPIGLENVLQKPLKEATEKAPVAQFEQEEITLVRPPSRRIKVEWQNSSRSLSMKARPAEVEFVPTILGQTKKIRARDHESNDAMFGDYHDGPSRRASSVPYRALMIGGGVTTLVVLFLFANDSVSRYFQSVSPGDSVTARATSKAQAPPRKVPFTTQPTAPTANETNSPVIKTSEPPEEVATNKTEKTDKADKADKTEKAEKAHTVATAEQEPAKRVSSSKQRTVPANERLSASATKSTPLVPSTVVITAGQKGKSKVEPQQRATDKRSSSNQRSVGTRPRVVKDPAP